MRQINTFRDAQTFGSEHADPTIRQYARNLETLCDWAGIDLSQPAEVETYLEFAPKYDKRDLDLQRRLLWSVATYKQYQRGGRLLLEHFTGERAAKMARKAIETDGWFELARRAKLLAEACLIDKQRLARLSAIADICRIHALEPTQITKPIIVGFESVAGVGNQWSALRNGAKFLDDLRVFPDMRDLLPPEPIGPIEATGRRSLRVPEHFDREIENWVKCATTLYPNEWQTEEIREELAKHHSEGARGIFMAGLRNYVATLASVRTLTSLDTLSGLFTETDVYAVTKRWNETPQSKGRLAPRTRFQYIRVVCLTLARNGETEAAANVAKALVLPEILEGKAATKIMSPKTERWCRDLLGDPDKVRKFETQHRRYAEIARQALRDASEAKFDLVELANDPAALQRLPDRRRGLAKALLRRARRFGVCAAFAALELEGAPFREANTLGLIVSGPKRTFFDHTGETDPYYRIVLPNELLKNGEALTRRGESLPPIDVRERGAGDAGVTILKFYLQKIRPLFPGHATSTALFPGLDKSATQISANTFSVWLLDCSSKFELPLTSHNFRHGMCSIQINKNPRCIDDLAVFLGDLPSTVRRYYAFLMKDKLIDRVQDHFSESRAQHGSANGLRVSLR